MARSRKRQALVLLLLPAAVGAGLLFGASAANADPTIASKRAQAQAVLEQVHEIERQVGRAAEAFNYATIQLQQIDGELRSNSRHLTVARSSLKLAQRHIAARLRSLYVNGDSVGAVEVILGAKSLDDLLSRLDIAQRVSEQDARVLGAVKQFRREVEVRRARLRSARARQAQVVAERAAQRRAAEGQLAERRRLLASVKDEIAKLQAEERQRQALLEAQARARLAEQQRLAAYARSGASESGSSLTDPSVATIDPASLPPARYGGVVGIAMQYLGVPYVWGGASPAGFDCSGFIMYVYAQIGVSLPHHAASQYSYGTPVPREALQPGDLLFFDGLGHAGIYIGGNQFIHAPHTGDVVKISAIDGWYSSGWVGARRL
jgi:cell wall-associated NlpC family hydrolase